MERAEAMRDRMVTVRLSEAEGVRLDQLCERYSLSSSSVLRMLIKKEHDGVWAAAVEETPEKKAKHPLGVVALWQQAERAMPWTAFVTGPQLAEWWTHRPPGDDALNALMVEPATAMLGKPIKTWSELVAEMMRQYEKAARRKEGSTDALDRLAKKLSGKKGA